VQPKTRAEESHSRQGTRTIKQPQRKTRHVEAEQLLSHGSSVCLSEHSKRVGGGGAVCGGLVLHELSQVGGP